MDIIKRIKNYFCNRKIINTVVKPFLKTANKDLNVIKLIDDHENPKVLEAYEQIKDYHSKKNRVIVQRFLNTIEGIKRHNSTVDEINVAVNEFDYQKVLDNPHDVTYQEIEKNAVIADKIQSFKVYPDIYYEYVDHINKLLNYFQELIEEYDLKKEYDALGVIESFDCYIDSRIADSLSTKRNELYRSAKSHTVIFYTWESDIAFRDRIEKKNKEFIEINKKLPLFDSINGRSLDEDQRTAVLTNETSTLVIAGAGSGKTLTICGKVQYLLKELQVDPKDILLLSYSKKSADDLQNKVSKINPNLTVGTFHKLGLDILRVSQNKMFAVEDQYKAIIESYFSKEVCNRPGMMIKILTYYGLYMNAGNKDKEYENQGDMFNDLKTADFVTLKDSLLNFSSDKERKRTLKKEYVKSYEELALANWYFINGIDYQYEKPYEINVSTPEHRQYLPDFTLGKYHIYHEHYGIDRLGQAKQYGLEEGRKYVQIMEWKRKLHEEHNTTCIETYSYEFEDGTVFTKLEKVLRSKGVKFQPLNDKQIFNAMESIYSGQTFKSLINLLSTFLSLYKATYTNADHFEELKKRHYDSLWQKIRADMFLDIVKDIYCYYMDYIRGEDKIDFDDMILRSTSELDKLEQFKYKYIIVDEFQDISVSRMIFLKKLIQHGNAKLFAAGDDWQAIYRFSGCDLNIFLHFGECFGFSKVTKISTTHRNSQELQDIASSFIKQNPEQIKKSIHSEKHLNMPIKIKYYDDIKYFPFWEVVDDISHKDSSAHVLILGRNNKDIESILVDRRIYIDHKHKTDTRIPIIVSDYPKMQFAYSTVHGSKGLEEDYVIIINGDDSRLGFPNKMEDDELLDLVLSSKSNYPYAEERRLWYVALTRARLYTYIIADEYSPSEFVKEIEDQCEVLNPESQEKHEHEILCPRCESGRLVLRASPDGRKFYGCSNYPYCDYTINDLKAAEDNRRCPVCGDFLILKHGMYGKFYGCHNYKNGCRHTEKVDEE